MSVKRLNWDENCSPRQPNKYFIIVSYVLKSLPGLAYFQNLLSFPFSSLHRISAQLLHPRPPSPVSVPLSLPPDDADWPCLCPHPCTLTPCPVTVPRSPAARIVFPQTACLRPALDLDSQTTIVSTNRLPFVFVLSCNYLDLVWTWHE